MTFKRDLLVENVMLKFYKNPTHGPIWCVVIFTQTSHLLYKDVTQVGCEDVITQQNETKAAQDQHQGDSAY